jgi:hypothetical protein
VVANRHGTLNDVLKAIGTRRSIGNKIDTPA